MTTSIGNRLSFSGDICTILWSGEITETQSQWYGVEWDHPTRGKHDGQYGGTRYYFCQFATSGSFVKKSKKTDGERTFIDAVTEKYGSLKEPLKRITWGAKVVEEIGFDKIEQVQGDFFQLRIVNLDSMLLASPQPILSSPRICPTDICELDLSRNLISHFEDLARICAGLKLLQSLRFNANRLSDFQLSPELTGSFGTVKLLALNANWLVWDQASVVQISEYFPSLEELQLGANFITTLEITSLIFPCLKILHLHNNKLTDWSQLASLSRLMHLSYLNLSGNKLSKTSIVIPQIEYLDITDNNIISWSEISSLEQWPSLSSLRVFPNPLFTDTREIETVSDRAYWAVTVVERNNDTYSGITKSERINAEIYYLSIISKSGRSEKDIELTEPRWTHLCHHYGNPGPPLNLKTKPKTLTFEYKGNKLSKRIIPSMTVVGVKGLCAKLFGLGIGEVRLLYRGSEVDDGMKDIGWYGIEDGDEIIVNNA
ncbi:Tubulin-specific chaperone E [Neolecta irregularis DAH-3]|uniref:Tubulin-specific chaperone E n=1 Tax=Neolecta irregularis (strain DAH-3) TaxID=1198029 RepID=A0A1U7LKE4_NEOID|nr:Tubulin-specific chaperone E [Neolecta irregularis DAH-3]|eukprot:OLL23108.1 Tubulin-specific chaperone E [Neolecta irregularis DAH-3]